MGVEGGRDRNGERKGRREGMEGRNNMRREGKGGRRSGTEGRK